MQFISLIMIVLLATPASVSGSAHLGETHSALELMTACQAPAEDLSSRAFCRGFVTAAYDGMNRPQFSRHSTAAFRTALHTLPAIAGY